jgi:hypothetical protein
VHAVVQTCVFGSQTPEVQSEPVRQDRPFPHFGQTPPPQSTSVSAPFRKPSEQLGAAQTCELGLQNPGAQSVETWQRRPTAQVFPRASQAAPPQSTSVSAPFFTPSVQVGVLQRKLGSQ